MSGKVKGRGWLKGRREGKEMERVKGSGKVKGRGWLKGKREGKERGRRWRG